MKQYNDLNERITRNIIHDSNKIIEEVLAFELYDIHDEEDMKKINQFLDWVELQRNRVINTAYQQGLLQFNDERVVTVTFDDYLFY